MSVGQMQHKHIYGHWGNDKHRVGNYPNADPNVKQVGVPVASVLRVFAQCLQNDRGFPYKDKTFLPDCDLFLRTFLTRQLAAGMVESGDDEYADFLLNGVAYGFALVLNCDGVFPADRNIQGRFSSECKTAVGKLFWRVGIRANNLANG